eukprot:gnl/Dysnectes_brevis/1071_a1195_2763.p1 GENE.gnl/Dysnectes_brevis/1071_a1195_2763~~gnl/Dysnectes_brevis/1071_a1195_2763.p1  ORF type:complete len:256 (-),score=9.62 gnl/Dysnectes_brevis/1071_a1195_2763:49-816(-)
MSKRSSRMNECVSRLTAFNKSLSSTTVGNRTAFESGIVEIKNVQDLLHSRIRTEAENRDIQFQNMKKDFEKRLNEVALMTKTRMDEIKRVMVSATTQTQHRLSSIQQRHRQAITSDAQAVLHLDKTDKVEHEKVNREIKQTSSTRQSSFTRVSNGLEAELLSIRRELGALQPAVEQACARLQSASEQSMSRLGELVDQRSHELSVALCAVKHGLESTHRERLNGEDKIINSIVEITEAVTGQIDLLKEQARVPLQ